MAGQPDGTSTTGGRLRRAVRIDAAHLAHVGRVQVQLIAVLVMVVLTGVCRARWMAIAHLLVALLAGGVLQIEQHRWGSSHTPPGCVRYDAHC